MTHAKSGSALALLALLLDASVRSAVLAALAWLVLCALKIRTAAVRHTAWTVVLFGMLVMPCMRKFLPVYELPVPSISASASVMKNLPSTLSARGADQLENTPANSEENHSPAAGHKANEQRWPILVLALYCGFALLLLAQHCIGHLFAWKLVRHSELVSSDEVLDLQHSLFPEYDFLNLRQSALLEVPITVGVLRPAIILPIDWPTWERQKLVAVLAHELSHVRRHDYILRILASLNKCLYWFNPLAWWLDSHLAGLAEQVSDDSALLAVSDPYDYAQVLLGFAARVLKHSSRVRWEGLAMATSRQVITRVERILSSGTGSAPALTRSTLVLLMVAAALLAGPTAAIELAHSPLPQKSRSASSAAQSAISAKSFVGNWRGGWRDTLGSQASLQLTLRFRLAHQQLTGTTGNTLEKPEGPLPRPTLPLGLAPPPPAPPPPPPPPPPPSGPILDPRIQGDTLTFRVKTPDGKSVNFWLQLHAIGQGTLKMVFPSHFEFYPELEMSKTE